MYLIMKISLKSWDLLKNCGVGFSTNVHLKLHTQNFSHLTTWGFWGFIVSTCTLHSLLPSKMYISEFAFFFFYPYLWLEDSDDETWKNTFYYILLCWTISCFWGVAWMGIHVFGWSSGNFHVHLAGIGFIYTIVSENDWSFVKCMCKPSSMETRSLCYS